MANGVLEATKSQLAKAHQRPEKKVRALAGPLLEAASKPFEGKQHNLFALLQSLASLFPEQTTEQFAMGAMPVGGPVYITRNPQLAATLAQTLGKSPQAIEQHARAFSKGGSQMAMGETGESMVTLLDTLANELGTRGLERTLLHEMGHGVQHMGGTAVPPTASRFDWEMSRLPEELMAWLPQIRRGAAGGVQAIKQASNPRAFGSYAAYWPDRVKTILSGLGEKIPSNPQELGKALMIAARKYPQKVLELMFVPEGVSKSYAEMIATPEIIESARGMVREVLGEKTGGIAVGPRNLMEALKGKSPQNILEGMLEVKPTTRPSPKAVSKSVTRHVKKATRGR